MEQMHLAQGESGHIALGDGFTFFWMVNSKDGEIWGGIENANRRMVPGSSGWWRTNDPAKAAELCKVVHLELLDKACKYCAQTDECFSWCRDAE